MKKFLLVLFSIFMIPYTAHAATCTSTASGNWSDDTKWSDADCGAGHVPGTGDQAIIAAGHTITLDGDTTVGTSPADLWTYAIDIYGTLYWPNHPGGDWTLTLQGTLHVRTGGVFQIADSATPLNSAHLATVLFDNVPANQRYIIYLDAGSFKTYGNILYALSSGSNNRARITACDPDCNAGAGREITLDRNVNWVASASATHDAILIGVGGSTTAPAAGDDPELITSWTSPAANKIDDVTLNENHMVGDIVEDVSRNILIKSDSDSYHSVMYPPTIGVNNILDINWTRFDEMGSTSYGAVTLDSAVNTMGTVQYVAVTNADEHAAGGRCFVIQSYGWTKFEGNSCHDTRGQRGFQFTGAGYSDSWFTVKNCSFFGATTGNAVAAYYGSSLKYISDGLWSSHSEYGVYAVNTPISINNSLIHFSNTAGIDTSRGPSYMSLVESTISGNEIRNIAAGNGIVSSAGGTLNLYNNDIDNAFQSCMYFGANASIYSESNTYDHCNTNDAANYSGIRFYNAGAGNAGISGTYRGYNEDFGSTTANHKSNISFYFGSYATGASRRFSGSCEYCKLAAPTNAETCGLMPSDGIYIESCSSGYAYAVYIDDEMYFTLHDKDQVSGTHVGWGPGGAYISRETVTVVDNTLNLKIQPGNATEYAYIKIGQVYARAGDTVTVSVQLRKDENQSAGFLPRLALGGNGFLRSVNYDEMTDVVNTWETQTVTGVVSMSGGVDIYVAVRNNLSGANAYAPVWNPTLEIFADGFTVSSAP